MGIVVKKVAYHQQIYEILQEKILSGELRSGEKINEFGLAQEMGVSRSPVREALRMLEQDGLVEGRSASGLSVTFLNYRDALEIYDCRRCLEPFAVRIGCQYVTEAVLKQLEEYVEKSKQYHEEGNMKEVVQYNTLFHDKIIELCPNKQLKNSIDRIRNLSRLVRNEEFIGSNRPKGYLIEHEMLIEALRERDGLKAERLLTEHIAADKEFYIQQSLKRGH
ncbi:GntR family transcriptional regulator [Lachnospiraceae bacterium 62-35]